MQLAMMVLTALAPAPSPAHPPAKFNVPAQLAGAYQGVSQRASQGYSLEKSAVDFTLDESGLVMSEFSDSGLAWSVHYPPPWLINALDDQTQSCLMIREAAYSTTPRLQLCFPSRFKIRGGRRVELTTFAYPQTSLATFVKGGSNFRSAAFAELFRERHARRVYGPDLDLIWNEIDLGRAREIMGKPEAAAKIQLIREAARGLAQQSDVEQIQRKYILTMGLNSDDPEVKLATLALVGKFSPTRSAVEFIRERLHQKTTPEFAAAALDLASQLSDEARRYREPFETLWVAHGVFEVAEVHALTGGHVSPAVMSAIRRIEHPRPDLQRWSEDDRVQLVNLLKAYAEEPEIPPGLRTRTREILLKLDPPGAAAKCLVGLSFISEKS